MVRRLSRLSAVGLLAVVACSEGPDIAIIGAGITGSTAALAVRRHLGDNARISVFEASGRIGGRVAGIEVYEGKMGAYQELGAAIFHQENRLVASVADAGGLAWRRFRMQSAGLQATTLLYLLERYGLSLDCTRAPVEAMMRGFVTLYDESRPPWTSLDQFLDRAAMWPLYNQSIGQVLRQAGCPDSILDGIVCGGNRANYGQNLNMNAAAGLVSQKGSSGGLYSIVGGNVQLVQTSLDKAQADVHLNTSVVHVVRLVGGGFRLEMARPDGTVLPGQERQLPTFDGLGEDEDASPLMFAISHGLEFQTTHTYIIEVWVLLQAVPPFQCVHISVDTSTWPCRELLTTETTSASHISSMGRLEGSDKIYKIFARQPLGEDAFASIFDSFTVIHHKNWQAYPKLRPGQPLPPLLLSPGLVYPNALEFVVSTMETQ
eukprot:gene1208-2691_t